METVNHKPAAPGAQEDSAWALLYAGVHQAAVADEVVKHLEAHPDVRSCHPALYMLAKTTLRMRKERRERNREIAKLVANIVFAPSRFLDGILFGIADICSALGKIRATSHVQTATRSRARSLRSDPAFTESLDLFEHGAGRDEASPASRGAKAA